MRVPLLPPLESRDSVGDKDSLGVNLFLEQEDAERARAVKRAGTKVESVRTHAGQGIFAYGTKVYIWDSSTTATAPASINISDLT
jgi:hypothetical protein